MIEEDVKVLAGVDAAKKELSEREKEARLKCTGGRIKRLGIVHLFVTIFTLFLVVFSGLFVVRLFLFKEEVFNYQNDNLCFFVMLITMIIGAVGIIVVSSFENYVIHNLQYINKEFDVASDYLELADMDNYTDSFSRYRHPFEVIFIPIIHFIFCRKKRDHIIQAVRKELSLVNAKDSIWLRLPYVFLDILSFLTIIFGIFIVVTLFLFIFIPVITNLKIIAIGFCAYMTISFIEGISFTSFVLKSSKILTNY